MNPINVGFKSSHWIRLMEASKEYETLTKAMDNGNSMVIMYTYHTLMAIRDGEINPAIRYAQLAYKSALNPTNEFHQVNCPFCNGTGVLELEYTPMRDLDTTKEVTVACKACGGVGMIDPMDILNIYADDAYPENAVVAVLSKDIETAKQVTSAFFNTIEQHRPRIEEESLDKYFREKD